MTPAKIVKTLEKEHRNSAQHLGDGEKALIAFACRYLQSVRYESTLVRHVIYFLCHCGASLSQTAIALIAGRTGRNVHEIAKMDIGTFRKSVTFSPKENAGRPRKIAPRLVPLITEYLLTREVTSKREIIRFLQTEHGLPVCWDVLNAVLREYELERLIQRRTYQTGAEDASPLFSAAPGSPARG